jgi:hypothetical protein
MAGADRLYTRFTGACRPLPAAPGNGAAGMRDGVLGGTRGAFVSGAAGRGCPGVTAGGLAAGVRALSLNDG